MDLVILLTTRFISHLDLQDIKKRFPYTKFILIGAKSRKASFALSESQLNFFDKYYEVESKIISDQDPLPTLSYTKVRNIIRQELSNNKYDSIHLICFDEGNLLLAAKLRKEFDIPGESQDEIKKFRDKLLMKKILAKNNIRIPRYTNFNLTKSFESMKNYYHELVDYLGPVFVIKPRLYAASFGIFIIKNFSQFETAIHQINKFNISYEAEEYIDGTLYHCDALLNDKEIKFIEACEYAYPLLEFLSGKNILTIPLKSNDPLRNNIIHFTEECLSALGAKFGSYHLEVFKNKKDELIFLEIATRAPGGPVILMYEKMYGVNLIKQEFFIRLQRDEFIKQKMNAYYLGAMFPIQKGKVISLNQPVIKSKYEMNWVVKQNDILDHCKSSSDYAASLIAWNDDYSTLLNDFQKLKNFVALVVAK